MTESVADRAPIDWASLLARVGPAGDRGLLENLRSIDLLRRSALATPLVEGREASALVWLIILLSMAHTIISLTIAFASTAPAGLSLHLIQRVLAAAFAAAGLLLGLASGRDRRRLLLLATFACASSAFARASLAGMDIGPIQTVLRSLWLEVFTPACLWQFAADFPRVTRFTGFDRFARRVATSAWIVGVLVFALNGLIAADLLHEASVAAFLPNHRSNLFWRVFTVLSILAVGAILVRSRRAPAVERRRVRRVTRALAAGTAPFLLLGLTRSVFASLDRWLLTATGAERLWLDAVVVVPLAAMPLLVAGAVVLDRPFERQLPIGRFVRAARMLTPGFRRRSTRLSVLAEALDCVGSARSSREVCSALERVVRDRFDFEDVRVFRARADGHLTDVFSNLSLPAGSRLPAVLRLMSNPLIVDEHAGPLEMLSRGDCDWLRSMGVALVLPIRARDDSLHGLVLCGGGRTRARISARDREWLAAVASAAAAACDVAASFAPAGDAACECPRCGGVGRSYRNVCNCGVRLFAAALPHCLDGRFLIDRRIGRGSIGVVYVARDLTNQARVALKTIPRLQRGLAARLRDEAQVMASLRHPALTAIHDIATWRGAPVLVLDYFPNGTLAQRLRRGALDCGEVLGLARGLAEALAYMHERGVRHGDLKPANIAQGSDGTPRLLDFGLTALLDALPGRIAGTLPYFPPEAFRGVQPGPLFDLWALGVVLIEASTGMHPFTASTLRGVRRKIRCGSVVRILDRLPLEFEPLRPMLSKALDPSPERRFQSAGEVLGALALTSSVADKRRD